MPGFEARRLRGLVQSDIRRMSRESDRAGAINLGQGICDLPTPPAVAEAAKAAIDADRSVYSYPEGDLALREAIAAKLGRDNGIQARPDTEIVVTAGATGAYTTAVNALLDPGDGILLMEPYYGYHLNAAVVAGLEPHCLTLEPPGFAVTEDALRAALRPHTRAVVVCTPANPSGKMFGRAELEAVARVAHERDLLVITDEIYEYIRFDGRPHISPATVDGLWPRTVSIMGLSKTFSITGWRMGYAVAPAPLARAIALVNDLYYVCAPTPLQHGVTAGFGLPTTYFAGLATDYQRKRERLCEALAAAGTRPIVPQGAYYVLADVSDWGFPTAWEAAGVLVEHGKVASVPGSAFYQGPTGDQLLRFCFAKDDAVLDAACERIRRFQPSPALM
ncbi:aminotransferase class I/II-fold pyridoxal phosphate-dependent enzyme [Streptomyces sp. NA02950]|uniref:pyridoxal phosphate-dependent aminotransferase n=1 Tax=Streptomyces sp. NA02950 TaxID=2742137 RepID=UPI0015912A66|nr:aminotransferase class I/II-fold pyridoxal phosphate-dependent enzyme [Streptomyces sp. NA02950]QKV96307.1 aminotransferase class I/II-fold pyridoxal phosphate-dependent enzyme [Streptomyces sp. NA02950]